MIEYFTDLCISFFAKQIDHLEDLKFEIGRNAKKYYDKKQSDSEPKEKPNKEKAKEKKTKKNHHKK